MRHLSEDVGRVTTLSRDGTAIVVDLNDFLGRAIYYFGDTDPKLTWICRRLLRPGDTFIDVGANFGLLTLCAARVVGPEGTVHAFEPQTRLAELLRMSLTLNDFRHVHIHQVALSDTEAVFEMFVPFDNSGAASLSRAGESGARIQVPVRRADRFFPAMGLTGPVRLMKLDVEGHECKVLEGMGDLLHQARPQAILFECKRPSQERSIPWLQDREYVIYGLKRTNLRISLVRWSEHAPVPWASDFLAIDTLDPSNDLPRALRLSF